ncbi:hypothetical protein [Zavarzinella formosa]|uniref:hypothetical protein n=1 Tax=Zavarzinella formosa TaxID=360055 RepID=UPI00030E5783|nr:hypothetical protein [Zavarzinella formosa]
MNRMIKGMLCGVMGLGAAASSGCMHGGDKGSVYECVADPCWPDRYASQARERQVAQFEPQVMNGHILDQTIWNMHFDAGSDRINAAGMDKLDQLARRRPAPDPVIYLQTTRDIPYDAEKPSDYVTKRGDLDSKRVVAIQKYMSSTLSGRSPSTINVEIHDPAYPGINGAAPRLVVPSPKQRISIGAVGGPVSTPGGSGAGVGAYGAPIPSSGPGGAPTGTPGAGGSSAPGM